MDPSRYQMTVDPSRDQVTVNPLRDHLARRDGRVVKLSDSQPSGGGFESRQWHRDSFCVTPFQKGVEYSQVSLSDDNNWSANDT